MAVNSIRTNAAPQLRGAIRQAARASGVSFEYLLTTAQSESNLNPAAQAPTSSAKGLYQFIEQTWLATMKGAGSSSGYGRFADAISRAADGRFEVANPAMRSAIMRLRGDPAASAMMAGSFTRNNAEQLRSAIGRQPSEARSICSLTARPIRASCSAAPDRPAFAQRSSLTPHQFLW